MKTGILTFHCAHNYGAVLQCYALQETLRMLGHDVEIIDYKPDFIVRNYKVFGNVIGDNLVQIFKCAINNMLCLRRNFLRHKNFNVFINKYLKIAEANIEQINSTDYDAYVIGSDQVWNPYVTHGFDKIYFGDFRKRGRCISYAASMETSSLTSVQNDFLKRNLKNFDAISVREPELAKLIAPLTNKKVNIVLDPTLLANVSIWNTMLNTPSNRKYVLVYQVQDDKNTIRIARKIATQLGADLITLVAWVKRGFQKGRKQTASPSEFVSLIKNASCVVTTSFHGTAFSVIFNRPFYCVSLKNSWNSRSKALLSQLHLDDRIIQWNSNPVFSDIDFTEANKKLEDLRESSLKFLKQALS